MKAFFAYEQRNASAPASRTAQETTELPRYYFDLVRKDLGLLWEWLPEGALDHDPNAYSKSEPDGTHALGSVLGIASEGRKNQAGGRL